MRWIFRVAVAAACLTYGLVVLGALVRATNSGLSCPDWPTCYGHWLLTPGEFATIPDTGYTYGQVMLEWVHRLIAGVFLGPLVLVLAGLCWTARRLDAALPRAALLLLGLLVVQGALGRLTVLDSNSPWSVAIHLGNALLVFSTILWLADRTAPRVAAVPRSRPSAVLPLAGLAWGLALLAMMSAAMTAKSGASLACSTWPLCDGAVIPDLGDPLIRLHFAHRVLAGSVALTLLALFVACRDAGPKLRRLSTAALVLVTCQVGLGALVILLQVPIGKAVLHQAVGVLTFAVVTLLLWSARGTPAGRVRRPPVGWSQDGLALPNA